VLVAGLGLSLSSSLYAQDGLVVRGSVLDATSGKPMSGAVVAVWRPAAVPHVSGVRWHGLVSPKANLAVQLAPQTTLFGNVGYGFHSNDARDVVAAARDSIVIPRALGAELGLRHYWTGGTLAAALWATDLQSELVYNGDEGTTEPSGRTRRHGLDLEGRIRLTPWLWADADLNLAHGRFR